MTLAVPTGICALTLALVLSSCGSVSPLSADAGSDASGDSVSSTQNAPATAAAFCAEYYERDSAYSARCLGGVAADWSALANDFLSCGRFDAFVAAGTVRYHKELAATCLQSQSDDRDCLASPNRCFTQTLEGLIAPNAPCENDYECPANAGCFAPQEFMYNACVQSTCVAVAQKVGDPCTTIDGLSLCFPGVVTCVQGFCAAYGLAGEPCGDDSLPACGTGLRCDAATSKCLPVSAGGSCTQDFDCLGTEYCAGSTCAPRIAIGSSCATGTGCVNFASCNPVTNLCEAGGHVGQACGSSRGEDYLCIDGFCQQGADGSQRCVARLPNGTACIASNDCASDGCADGLCAACSH